MAALEAAARDNDDDPPTSPNGDSQNASGGGGKSCKGKLDSIKQEDDIKKEFMDDGSAGGGDNSQHESSAGVGKNVNNDGTAKLEIKTEDGDVKIKSEPMEVDEAGGGSGTGGATAIGEAAKAVGTGDSKDDIKPMTDGASAAGGDVKIKTETKPVVPEPLMSNAGDKKKKCGKYFLFFKRLDNLHKCINSFSIRSGRT